MSMNSDAGPPSTLPAGQASPASKGRRRLLGGGLSAAPVVLSVASKPVLGSTLCAFASATGSAGSMAQRTATVCSGLSPAQWKAQAGQWPMPYCATQNNALGEQPTRYHCPTTGFSGRVFGDLTMLEVLDVGEGAGGTRGLGRYMVAALLNACTGRTPVLNETGVRMMWNDLVNQGYYEPTAGVRWTAPEIIAYLGTTMG